MDPNARTTLESPDRASARPRRGSRWGIRLGAIVALAVAAGLAAWVRVDSSDESSTPRAATPVAPSLPEATETVSKPKVVTVPGLRTTAAVGTVPLYWAGERPGTRLEFSRSSGGTTFVRYLPPDARAGDPQPRLTVATYVRSNGFAEVQSAAAGADVTSLELEGGGLAVYDPRRPTNVHVAYPGQGYQVEVFSPLEGVAVGLVRDGAIRPIQ